MESVQTGLLLWQCKAVFDSLCLLALVGILWFALRKRVSPQWGIALFLLVILKAAVPIAVPVPESIASHTPARLIGKSVTENSPPVAKRICAKSSFKLFWALALSA